MCWNLEDWGFTKMNRRREQNRVKCSYCGGRGKYQVVGTEMCGPCVGTGRNLREDIWGDYCRECKGAKSVPYRRWVVCKSGYGH